MPDMVKKTEPTRVFRPSVDIVHTEAGLTIWADVPGAVKDGVDVKLDGDAITVNVKVDAPELEGLPLLHREYLTGNYEISFRISREIDREKITAELVNGVLVLTLPRMEAVKPRHIEIKAA